MVRKTIYDLPEIDNMKHVPLTGINDLYEIYENGKVFSRLRGRWLTQFKVGKNVFVTLRTKQGNISYSNQILKRKYFIGIPEVEYVQHKPLKNYEDLYQVYSDGRIFSKISYEFLTPKKTKSNWKFVCILDKKKRRKTCYIARAVWQSFVGPISCQYKIKYLDEDRQNCCLQNLDLVMKEMYTK